VDRIPAKEFRDSKTFAIIGAAMEVHRELGCGFLEPVYQEALAIELEMRKIPSRREQELPVYYKGRLLKTPYRADSICYDKVIAEIKALSKMGGVEEAQVIHYLKATGHEVGLLLNFGALSLEYKRLVYTATKAGSKAAHPGSESK